MPRPKPLPENAPVRTTISIQRKVSDAAGRLIEPDRPALEDFSGVMTVALVEYLNRHHPGLLEEVAREIRAGAVLGTKSAIKNAARDDGPSVDALAAGEDARRRRLQERGALAMTRANVGKRARS